MKTCKTVLLLMLTLGLSYAPLLAKRGLPDNVAPVTYQGVRYSAPHWGSQRPGGGENGGYVEARNAATNQILWDRQVYKVKRDPRYEDGDQDVFITSLSVQGGKLIVVNERGNRYVVDLRTRKSVKIGR